MRRLALSVLLVTLVFPFGVSSAQESEIELPDARIFVGVGEINEDGKLQLKFGPSSPAVPVTETVSQTYTVMVPYTEMEERDGKQVPVTKTRPETRTRTVPVTRMVQQEHPAIALDELKFFNLSGDEVTTQDAEEHFGSKQPIIGIARGATINAYFEQIFRDDILIVELPESSAARGRPGTFRSIPMPRPRARAAGAKKDDDKKDDDKKDDDKKDDDDG